MKGSAGASLSLAMVYYSGELPAEARRWRLIVVGRGTQWGVSEAVLSRSRLHRYSESIVIMASKIFSVLVDEAECQHITSRGVATRLSLSTFISVWKDRGDIRCLLT